jgi:hypothetical protein
VAPLSGVLSLAGMFSFRLCLAGTQDRPGAAASQISATFRSGPVQARFAMLEAHRKGSGRRFRRNMEGSMNRLADIVFMALVIVVLIGSVIEEHNEKKLRARLTSAA